MASTLSPVERLRYGITAAMRGDQRNVQEHAISAIVMLHDLGLHGAAKAVASFDEGSRLGYSEYTEWLCQLLQQEKDLREKRRYERRLRAANLGDAGTVEDADRLIDHGLDLTFFRTLLAGEWIRARENLLFTGPAGVGKTWLAYLLGHRALVDGFSVSYYRAPRLFEGLRLARADGTHNRMLRAIARLDVLILDDWGFERLNGRQRHDWLEVIWDRFESRSTIVISRLPVEKWYGVIDDPTTAVAVFDCLVHNAHRIELKGDSLHAQLSKAPHTSEPATTFLKRADARRLVVRS